MNLHGFDLSGRVALVTGASSGIGKHWSELLAMAGASVVLAARRADRLESLRNRILASGGKAIAVSLDVADEASIIAAYDAAEAAFGTVDTIIANAGVSGEGAATEIGLTSVDETLAINLRGAFVTAREGARRLIASEKAETGRGRVIITSSITAFKVDPGLSIYSATKAAVVQMGKVLAREWLRKGINVNMLCPGYIRTEINADWFDSPAGQRQVEKFHRGRLMAVQDLDVPLLFLASDASRAVTGTALTVDDGQSL